MLKVTNSKFYCLTAGCFVFLLSSVITINAAVFTVTTNTDTNDNSCDAVHCTFREAIGAANAASSNDFIAFSPTIFNVARNIVLGNAELNIANNGSLTINGTGSNLLSIIGSQTRIFRISAGARATITNLIIRNGNAGIGNGGGILNEGGTLNLTDVTINNNGATNGGGIFTDNGGTVTLQNSTLTQNVVTNAGGAIAAGSGTLNITNTTITANIGEANAKGGGMSVGSALVNLQNVTIAKNTSGLTGGVENTGNSVNARNTIIADNTATAGTAHDFSGNLNSLGYNLIENTTSTNITGNPTGNILGQDPQILPLGNRGGITQTMALLASSPAVDRADPQIFPQTDQRAKARPQDGDLNGSFLPDIGAYEREVIVFNVTKTADTNDGMCDADCSLREAISQTNASLMPDNAVTFEPSLFATPQTITLTSGQLVIQGNKTFHLKGTGANLLSLSGNNQSRIFQFNEGTKSVVEGVTITNGREGGAGGLYLIGGTILVINDSVITNNTATAGGAGGIGNGSGVMTINNSKISNNTSTDDGAGFQGYGTNTFNNVVVENNTVTNGDGGGIAIIGGNTFINNSLITGNKSFSESTSARNGGGIYFAGDALTVNNSVISNNICGGGRGGGIYNDSIALVQNSTIIGNSANFGGGIASLQALSLTLTGSTVSGNTAMIDGGGIMFILGSTLPTSINSSTIANNTAMRDGGGIFSSVTNINVKNTLIADNRATNSAPDLKGTIISQGYNLIENVSGAAISGTTGSNLTGIDPMLAPLGSYGGATPTHALRRGSQAIDRGNNFGTPTDQRGMARPFDDPQVPNADGGDGTDIGAFERQPTDVDRRRAPFDFDGDGKTDISIFRPAAAEWWINRSSNGSTIAAQFGASTDRAVPADFSGDGKTDVAIFRPSTGEWFILRSEDGSFYSVPFGAAGDIPVAGDFDADGRADPAVFRPSSATWFISKSSGGTIITTFGIAGDVSVTGDYDGDGKTDIAIYRPASGEWWIQRSSNDSTYAFQFGTATDKPVQGDYTGDGKTDTAFFRPASGEWFILRSEDSSFYSVPFGASGDAPVPGDYDGDGRFDTAVFRPSGSTWFINRSSAGILITSFGIAGDQPVPNVFVPYNFK